MNLFPVDISITTRLSEPLAEPPSLAGGSALLGPYWVKLFLHAFATI